ncbi:LysR family transcriptional regulator [Rhodobacter xanthinilyticus]|uniref:LysR family transcriptional regulator n=1 Tax=Rhodobacter xanthinilyticus TaxID=1850250 RepID=UPI000A873C74|nr:LysR family transcriptional regulator [Rhodobacter xanthinilyticus]
MSLPPLTALRAFEAAIRHGRMTRAAEELGVTHGAISRQVRLLEETFGAQLITRTRSGLVPTQAGAALAERLTRGFREIEAAWRRCATMRGASSTSPALAPSPCVG